MAVKSINPLEEDFFLENNFEEFFLPRTNS
jgi:hypothetical protein